MPIQPRAPSLRENSASNTAQQLARRSAGTAVSSRARNSRISLRNAAASAGSATGSNLKACTAGSARLLSREPRLALLEERGDGFFVVLRLVRESLECSGKLQDIAQALLLSLAQQPLGEPQRLRWIGDDTSRDSPRFVQQLIGGHDARDQAE